MSSKIVDEQVQPSNTPVNDQSHPDDEGIIYIKHGEEFEIYDNPESEYDNSDNDDSEKFDEPDLAELLALRMTRDRSKTSIDARVKQKEMLNDVDTLLNLLSSAKVQITSNG